MDAWMDGWLDGWMDGAMQVRCEEWHIYSTTCGGREYGDGGTRNAEKISMQRIDTYVYGGGASAHLAAYAAGEWMVVRVGVSVAV